MDFLGGNHLFCNQMAVCGTFRRCKSLRLDKKARKINKIWFHGPSAYRDRPQTVGISWDGIVFEK